jgi:hypothetical protein
MDVELLFALLGVTFSFVSLLILAGFGILCLVFWFKGDDGSLT